MNARRWADMLKELATSRPSRTENGQGVVINPLLVATIQRLPHSTTESTVPSPGTVSPRAAFHVPPGPSSVAMPLTTFRTVQPGMVVGLVSGTGTRLRLSFGGSFFVAVCDVAESRCVIGGGELRS